MTSGELRCNLTARSTRYSRKRSCIALRVSLQGSASRSREGGSSQLVEYGPDGWFLAVTRRSRRSVCGAVPSVPSAWRERDPPVEARPFTVPAHVDPGSPCIRKWSAVSPNVSAPFPNEGRAPKPRRDARRRVEPGPPSPILAVALMISLDEWMTAGATRNDHPKPAPDVTYA